jgi:hypothetical protein
VPLRVGAQVGAVRVGACTHWCLYKDVRIGACIKVYKLVLYASVPVRIGACTRMYNLVPV